MLQVRPGRSGKQQQEQTAGTKFTDPGARLLAEPCTSRYLIPAQEMLVNMVRRFIFAQYPRPMAVTVFGNVLASIADVRELSSIKRHRQLAVANARAAAAAQETATASSL